MTLRIDEVSAGDADFVALDRVGPMASPRPPDEEAVLLLARRAGEPVARASVRVAEDLTGAPGRSGLVGHYEARDAEAGVAVLAGAVDRLRDREVRRVVGPMDGTTWDRYRLALPTPLTGDPAPFLTEPTNPPEYPAHFEAAGFDVVEWYVSQLLEDLGALADRTEAPAEALRERGVRLEPLDPDRFDEALDELHALSTRAFADNPYYSPIGLAPFRTLYEPMRGVLDPELVLVARRDDQALGFVLAFPDLIDPAGRPTRVIVKSLAVLPEGRGMGLGSLLVHAVHRRAADRDYDAVIHALMHVGNDSLKISSHGGRVFRHYALYGTK